MGDFMSNPTNKYTEEEFKAKVFAARPGVIDVVGFVGVDHQVTVVCEHGEYKTNGWNAMKPTKHCCKIAYFSAKATTRSEAYAKNTEASARERLISERPNLDVSSAIFVVKHISKSNVANIFEGATCHLHGGTFDVRVYPKRITNCPVCTQEQRVTVIGRSKPHENVSGTRVGSFVSTQETNWLDELNVPVRQFYLKDVKYRVDGYDPSTNTVYLFHGRFWHGCPDTYDPDFIHPIAKLPMKDLYDKTMEYEKKIKDAGYNLVVQWG